MKGTFYLTLTLLVLGGFGVSIMGCSPAPTPRKKKKVNTEEQQKDRDDENSSSSAGSKKGTGNPSASKKRAPTSVEQDLFDQASALRDKAKTAYKAKNFKEAKKHADAAMRLLEKLQEKNENFRGLQELYEDCSAYARGRGL